VASLAAAPRRLALSGRSWIPACRIAAAGVLAIAIFTAGWFPGPAGPHWARLAGLGIAALLVIVALLQFAAGGTASRGVGLAALSLDVLAIVFLLWAYSFDPAHAFAPLALFVVIEASLVAGAGAALIAWGVVVAGFAGSVAWSHLRTHSLVNPLPLLLLGVAGLAVALVVGRMARQVTAERNARLIETEGQRRRFHDTVWDLDAIVWESDAAGHQFYFVSHPAERILGYPVERWTAEPGFRGRIIHPEDRGRAVTKYREVATGGRHGQFEYRMVSAEDSVVWVTDRVTPVRDPDGRIRQLRGVTIDITRRKQAEEGLRNSFGMLFAANPLPMWAYDRDTLRFLAVNDAAVGLYGYTREEFLQMRITDVCSPEEVDRLLIDMLRNRGAFERSGEWRHHTKDGSGIDVEITSHTLEFDRRKASLVMAEDITERKRAEKQLREAEVRFRTLVEQIPAITYVSQMDPDRSSIYMSPQVQDLLGYSQAEWRTESGLWTKLLHPEDIERVTKETVRANETGEPFVVEYRLLARDGSIVWVRDEAILMLDERGEPQFWQGVMVDITDRKQAEREIAFLAYHDKLTGLPNRAMFQEVLDLALARARRAGQACAVLYLDLDNFKLVNDSLGHGAGDDLLRQMGVRLRETVRESDLVSRVGGDEFLILLADLDATDEAGPGGRHAALLAAETLASRIQDSLRMPYVLEGDEVYVSASIGVSVFPLDAEDGSSLLKNADVAMYRSKRDRPGGCLIFAEDARASLPDLSFATRLRKAVEGRRWVLHYQPIVDLQTGRTTAVESLVRWNDPESGLIYPNDFIPLAEELGLIGAIGDWVLEEMGRQHLLWSQQDGQSIDMTFNLSPRQLWEPDLVENMTERLRAAGVDPATVVVEITESTAMTDLARGQPILWDLHRSGFRLAIDDFGTGYSSLARLRNLPIDILKIDRVFVGDLPNDSDARSMVEAIIRMAIGLGMQPLAEGIETDAQRRFLADRGCSLGQGYLFSPPRAAAEVRPFLTRGHAFAL
jgi:diguanylate cyclase (GGDEF)-like protein/PAS domain S-box-containing protein